MAFVGTFFHLLIEVLNFLVIGRFILSWIDMRGQWRLTQVVHELTEPVLAPIRQILPNLGGLDLSPMVALLLLQLIGRAF